MQINYYGSYSLLKKEVLRFLKVYHQTFYNSWFWLIEKKNQMKCKQKTTYQRFK